MIHLLPVKTPTCRRFNRRNAFRLWTFKMPKGVKYYIPVLDQ